MSTELPKDPVEITDLVLRIWRWKWQLIIATVVGCVLTFIGLKLLTPEYESFAILYPSASSSREKLLDEFSFGYDIHAERLVQMIESTSVRDSVVNKFNLAKRYKVNQNKRGWEDEVTRMYFKKIHANKTKYKSVAIVVRDENPDSASIIANYISNLVNVVNSDILKSSANSQLETMRKAYEDKEKEISQKYAELTSLKVEATEGAVNKLGQKISSRQSRISALTDSLSNLRSRYQVFNIPEQIQSLNQQLVEAHANYLQDFGNLEILQKTLTPTDSILIRTQGKVAGAQKRIDYFNAQLAELTSVMRKYQIWSDRLEVEKSGQGYAMGEYERLSASYLPTVENPGAERIQADLSWDILQLNDIKQKYEKILSNYLDPLPASYIISEARPSYRKVFPNTLISLAIAFLFSFFFTYIVLLFREKLIQKMRQ